MPVARASYTCDREWLRVYRGKCLGWPGVARASYTCSREWLRVYRGGRLRGYRGNRLRVYRGNRLRVYRGNRLRGYRGGRLRGYRGGRLRVYRGGRLRVYRGACVCMCPIFPAPPPHRPLPDPAHPACARDHSTDYQGTTSKAIQAKMMNGPTSYPARLLSPFGLTLTNTACPHSTTPSPPTIPPWTARRA